MDNKDKIALAAAWLNDSDGLLVTAGAGMGVDSGLPDFRGPEGFWHAYPMLKAQGMNFYDIASPAAIRNSPSLGWGFYGHRLALYRKTQPHDGFRILVDWAARMTQGAFIFTSNVDGQFQKAGFPEDRIHECHGSIHRLQCIDACTGETWRADQFAPQIDARSCQLENAVPRCPHCREIARPNILMFGDYEWIDTHFERQRSRLNAWLSGVKELVVIELGAGKAIPTVRSMSERNPPRVIRINPRESAIPPQTGVGIAMGAFDALQQIDAAR